MLLPASQLNQPLPFDVRAGEWSAELHRWTPSLSHAGIEQLTIGFSKVSNGSIQSPDGADCASSAHVRLVPSMPGSQNCCRRTSPR